MMSFTAASFDDGDADSECNSCWLVRKWDDNEYLEPTVDYMGIELDKETT